jgi:DNA-binding response OmpR family regulator
MASLKVLVADDDEDMRVLVATLLDANGFDVLQAADGEAALDLLNAAVDDPGTCPDVVVADVKMPKFSGLGVLSALRRADVHLPVILMTALGDGSVGTLARRLGAVDVLRKPFAPGDLLRAMTMARTLRARMSPRADK